MSKQIITPVGNFGPYELVETLPDRYRADGADLPFTVVGEGSISDYVGAPVFRQPPPPASITARQARLVLLQRGLLANVPVAIAALPSPQKEAAQIEWEYATTLERASPLLVGLADALGWPAETVDEIFRVGKAL